MIVGICIALNHLPAFVEGLVSMQASAALTFCLVMMRARVAYFSI